MADASELEQWQVQPRGTSPWLLAIFIVLTIGGLVGCYFLYTKLADSENTTDRLKGYIKADIEDVLRNANIKTRVSGSSSIRYEEDFFSDVRKYLERGVKYDDYVKLVGWASKDELLKLLTSATDVRAMMDDLKSNNQSLNNKVKMLEEELTKARADRKNAKDSMEQLRRTLQKSINQKLAELAKLKEKNSQTVKKLQGTADQVESERKTLRKQVDELKAKLAKEEKAKAAEIKKLQAQLAACKSKIAKLEELEPEPAGPDGKILQVDLGLKFAVINIGARDNVERGEKFMVFEMGRGGAKKVKGMIVVRTVEDKVSQVGIVRQNDRLNPIIAGDSIKRMVRRRKYAIEKRAAQKKPK